MERDSELRRFLLGLAGMVSLVSSAAAAVEQVAVAASSPHRSEISVQGFYDLKATTNVRGDTEVIPTVRLTGRIHTEGRIDARFQIRKNKNWRSSVRRGGQEHEDPVTPILLQGRIGVGGGYRRSGSRVMPTAASIVGKELKVSFAGRAKGVRRSRQRIYTIKVNLDGTIRVSARIASIPAHAFKRGACAAPVGEIAANHTHRAAPLFSADATGETERTVSRKIITISTDADPEWYAKYGAKSNAEIASIINAAEVMYDRQLGIRFKIVRQHIYTDSSPYRTTNSGALLSAFVDNAENAKNLSEREEELDDTVNLKHLFTGRNLDGAVLGIAYIGTVCAAPRYSYGVTQSYLPVANFGIFAHEVGHNLGAFHDTSDTNGLMYPSIKVPPASRFSGSSLSDISYHLDTFGACLSKGNVEPLPTPVATPEPEPTAKPTPTKGGDIENGSLSINSRLVGSSQSPVVRIAGRLRAEDGTRVPNVIVYLMSGAEPLAAATTNREGVYQFFVRVSIRAGKKLGLYVKSENGELKTRTLYLSRTGAARNKSSARLQK